ncbi:MAG: RNA polymerase factor sigma-54 [candidate division WOR-3 bacterium]
MKHETELKNELRLMPSPRLMQFLTLLQIPTVELDLMIRRELESNPCLEEVIEVSREREETQDEYNIVDLFGEDTIHQPEEKAEDEFDLVENIPAPVSRLGEELLKQARVVFRPEEMKIAEFVVINLNENGFLLLSNEEIAQALNVSQDRVQEVIRTISRFNPVGCGARTVQESFLIQLEELGYGPDSIEYILVRDHFEDLGGSKRRNILNKLGITSERLNEAIKIISKLETRPGRKYFTVQPGYVNPDFSVEWREGKLWAVYNDDYLPKIRLKTRYVEMIKHPELFAEEEIKFVKKNLKSAQFFLLAIEQRRMTLNRIINKVIEHQREFFEKGYEYLKPITMTDLAQQLGVNVSTISRAIQGKYVESPWGIHDLKFFFSAPFNDMDKRIIMKKIEEYVNREDKSRPLSDQAIAKRLNREGIAISRRTVTKYREMLGIPAHYNRTNV